MDLHPLIVHFPIVCILLAAIFDLAAHLSGDHQYHKTGMILLIAGALSTIPSAFTGDEAAELAKQIPGIKSALYQHQDLSTIALWLSLALAITRIHLVVRKKYVSAAKWTHMIAVSACAGVILWSAYVGGSLVYEYGAGTRAQQQLETN